MSKKKISKALKIKILILTLMAGILFTSSNSMPLVNAQPIPTSLTIAVPSPPLGTPFWSECTIEATLKDENDNPLQNMDIDFVYACDDHTHLLGTAKTDSNGIASLTHTFEYNPYYVPWRISAYFSGTTSYDQSSSEYVDIMIIDYTPYLVGGGLIILAIIGVVGYIVFRRRKKAITLPMTTKVEKKMRINPLQIGFSIIMGWVIVIVSGLLQPIIGEVMYWIVLLLGLSFIVLGFIKKEKMISPHMAKTLLQIGMVVTIMWVIIFIQREGPYDLGLPKLYIPTGYTPDGVPISTNLPIILFLALPVLGFILLALGIVLNRKKKD